MTNDFTEKRRQLLLPQTAYEATVAYYRNGISETLEEIKSTSNRAVLSCCHDAISNNLWKIWQLRYTAGDNLADLAQELDEIVKHHELYAELDDDFYDPFILDEAIDPYIDYLNLLSVTILLHREDLIPRIYGLIEGGAYDGHDLVIEELLKFYLPGRPEIDEWLWNQPYRIALEALDEKTAAERENGMREYVKAWYPSMKGRAGFWGKHTKIDKNNLIDYTGYWTMEAAALSYLFDIDDSSYRDEMVYPKDLADYARSQPRRTPEAALRAIPPSPTEAGQACPREGWWSTSAKRDSRRYFALGEVFPAIPSATARGFVLWQWEDDQTVSPSAPLVQASSGEAAARVGLWRMDSDARVRCYVQQGEPLPLHSGQPVRWIWLEDTPGMRARSGEPCPYPGVWTCEEAPSIERAFGHGVTLPTLDGRAVTWRLVRLI
ncbi:PoNe immunity protein domain-containing protein [Caballeronia sp. SL2Y3]|uniref:PoNe immunity protein domain-containing protein n=1 Tax=Caballeronia sp. SL2Y3 TaxID=2878151 RepID=UPI001FD5CF79|nr:PoNe immunity protein domain-containing protein [Caballeronia sp. SL2Y3]